MVQFFRRSPPFGSTRRRVNHAKNNQPQLVIAGFLNHQQYHGIWRYPIFSLQSFAEPPLSQQTQLSVIFASSPLTRIGKRSSLEICFQCTKTCQRAQKHTTPSGNGTETLAKHGSINRFNLNM